MMASYWLALLGAAVTQAVNIGIMLVKGRRQSKGDRISDLHSAQNARFAEMRADADRKHDALVALITAQGQDIKDLDHRLTGELKAQGDRTDRVLDVLRDHGERLARIEVKLDIDPSAEAALRLSAPQPAP